MISRLLVILWQIVIFLFSSQPATDSKNLSSGLTEMFLDMIFPRMSPQTIVDVAEKLSFVVRKGAHFTIYFILGMLMYNCISRIDRFKRSGLISFVFCLLYAEIDEIHQIFVDGRAGRVLDVCIDSFGSLCGILVLICLTKIYKKRNLTGKVI